MKLKTSLYYLTFFIAIIGIAFLIIIHKNFIIVGKEFKTVLKESQEIKKYETEIFNHLTNLRNRLDTIEEEKKYLSFQIYKKEYPNKFINYLDIDFKKINLNPFANTRGLIEPISIKEKSDLITLHYGKDRQLAVKNIFTKDSVLISVFKSTISLNPPFYFKLTKDGIKINAFFTDLDGKLILWIKDNYWVANVENSNQIKSTKNSIIINDSAGIPIINLKFLDNYNIYFDGLLIDGNTVAYLTDSGIQMHP